MGTCEVFAEFLDIEMEASSPSSAFRPTVANLRTPHSLDLGNSTYPESTACASDS